ncbi:hypothetical protein PCAR4_870015 [Paraburkholderia caribensis]|nr:hypothetical protein PCAR4_870015 [Paraburkholderia caribensis]
MLPRPALRQLQRLSAAMMSHSPSATPGTFERLLHPSQGPLLASIRPWQQGRAPIQRRSPD